MNKNDILKKYWDIEMNYKSNTNRYIQYCYEKWDFFIWCEIINQYWYEFNEITEEIKIINISDMPNDTQFLVMKNNKII